ncbi:MAG: CDP-alcohol phosphatidyltransferase family protein [Roseiflexus sp.]
MFTKRYNTRIRRWTGDLVARTLGRTGLHASTLTVLNLLFTLASVWWLASGQFFIGGLIVAFASLFDVLDGALARAKNQTSRFGSFLDSTLDRYADMLIFFGLLIYFEHSALHTTVEILLIFAAATGSLLTSYIRARAEGCGFNCKVGLLERPERIALIVLGLLTGWVTLMLWCLAILSNITALQRFIYVWMQSRAKPVAKRTIQAVERGK